MDRITFNNGVAIFDECINAMKRIKPNSVDMILADLPYGTTQCKWDTIIPFDDLWKQYNRIIKDRGVIALFGTEPFSSSLRISNIKNYRYDWIWEKSKATGFLNSKRRPLVAHEIISIFWKNTPKYYPQMTIGKAYNKGLRKKQTGGDIYGSYKQKTIKSDGERYPRSVLYYKTAESEGKTYHKTQKPVSLCEYLIKTYTKEGDLVLDNVAGSGTTAVACQNTNRRFVIIENDITNKQSIIDRLI